jgi:hypothetical protein
MSDFLTTATCVLVAWLALGLMVAWGFGKTADATRQDGPAE